MPPEDKRRDPRVPQSVPVKVKYGGADDFLKAFTENISLGGVFIATNVAVPMGTKVDLTIELAPGKGMKVAAEVAWHRKQSPGAEAGVGLKFVSINPQYQQWLQQAVSKYLHEQGRKEEDGLKEREHKLRKASAGRALRGAALKFKEEFAGVDGLVLGIDLGTSNTSISTLVGGDVKVIEVQDDPDGLGKSPSIPSVVAFDDAGKPTIGRQAMNDIDNNARRTVFGAKRFIGRPYESPAVQQMLTRFPYKIVPGAAGQAAVEINGKPINLVAISSRILEYVKGLAAKELNRPVEHAVVTVPAFYNDNQRSAVVHAGRLAGLNVLRVLNEPTAAAIAYGLAHVTPRKLLVYDLGGGTFDVSVMAVREDSLTVLATAGDTFLGGEDFDQAIVRHVSNMVKEKVGKALSSNHVALVRVKVAAERAKRRLSSHERTMVTVRDTLLTDGSTTRIEVELDRSTLRDLVEDLVARTLKICDMAIGEAGLQKSDLGDVLLVGGQTLMPYVQEQVAQHFNVTPRYDLSPDSVVALGAGMLAYMPKKEKGRFEDVLSMSIGVGLPGGRYKRLVPRNTPVPHNSEFKMQVPKDRFNGWVVEVYQGDHEELHRNEHLGNLKIDHMEAGPQDPVPVIIHFVLTPDCLLKVRLENVATGESADVLLDTREMAAL